MELCMSEASEEGTAVDYDSQVEINNGAAEQQHNPASNQTPMGLKIMGITSSSTLMQQPELIKAS
jgi:hypothetical protein